MKKLLIIILFILPVLGFGLANVSSFSIETVDDYVNEHIQHTVCTTQNYDVSTVCFYNQSTVNVDMRCLQDTTVITFINPNRKEVKIREWELWPGEIIPTQKEYELIRVEVDGNNIIIIKYFKR